MKSSILAIIPARANSKRIPGKNKKPFLGKPLITWTIEAALASKSVTDVVVTTDDNDILEFKPQYSKVQFHKRPSELAQDSTPGVDPVLHLMENMKQKYDYVLLLQPTSPLRTHQHIEAAIELINSSNKPQLVSVKKMNDPINHIVYLNNNKINFLKDRVKESPPNDSLMVLNGAIYISKWCALLSEKTFLGSEIIFFEMDETVSVDIDLPSDWQRAEQYANLKVV